MASFLRAIVAGPRLRHPEAGLDLCYVTDNIVVTSGPSSTYPARAYRNPTDAVVKWLDSKHGDQWMIWEFRAEGTGYPDSEVHGRVKHYPFPDHHPPPFQMIPAIMGSMRNWLQEEGAKEKGRTVVIHCKAGKGRSGTMATSYLISQEGWAMKDALNRFTEKRMRPGFGNGVSIPSQIRWVGYVDRWTKTSKKYVERRARVKEVHVWGLRDGVKVSVEGFVNEGRKIKTMHTFKSDERLIVDGTKQNGSILSDMVGTSNEAKVEPSNILEERKSELIDTSEPGNKPKPADSESTDSESGGKAVIFRSSESIDLETSDICIDFERRNHAKYGWTMVTSIAHVWFNVYFEGLADNANADVLDPPRSGVFNIEWDAMDGIKGTSRKGVRAFDRLAVVWEAIENSSGEKPHLITQPRLGERVPEGRPSNWRGEEADADRLEHKDLGLRTESPQSANLSKANSVRSANTAEGKPANQDPSASEEDRVFQGVQSHGLSGGSGIRGSDGDGQKVDADGVDSNDSKLSSVVEKVRAAAGYAKDQT